MDMDGGGLYVPARVIYALAQRRMNRSLFLSILLLTAMSVGADTIDYEITSITNENGTTLLAKAVKQYSVKDIVVEERNRNGEIHWAKSLPLQKDFAVGASVYREPKLTGFGLWASGGGCRSFSWEWFNMEKPGIFKKLQEGGVVEVAYQGLPLVEEIAEITFMTDISLRVNNGCEVGKVTHRVLVKKGSVLRFAP